MRSLILTGPTIFLVLAASTAVAQTPAEIRRAIDRALPPIQKSADTFVAKRACVSCHHNILPILMAHMASARGLEFNSRGLEDKILRALTLDDAIQAVTLNDPTPNDSFLLMAASAVHVDSPAAKIYAHRLVQWQREDGHWITSDFRPPHSSSYFTATASAIKAISAYGSPDDRRCFTLAAQWLAKSKPLSTEDAAFRLMGLVWAAAPQPDIEAARRDLHAMRKPSSGWPELPGYEPDAYSTGEALYALNLGTHAIPDTHSSDTVAINTARRFLISSQAQDGTWHVHTRMLSPAEVSPDYFTTGFPYRKDEYLSYAGSVWAVMGLLTALPVISYEGHASDRFGPPEILEIAPFLTLPELRKRLDAGLDPNAKSERGTTLLMMSATDPEKVRTLLAHGADPKARATSGVDALTIAASGRGTAASIQALLEAGAEPNLPEGVRSKNTPLLMAAMTGDVENLKLLLAHGARPTAAALSEAVTFGYPDIVRLLIDSGVNPKLTESSGINLLHWAAIANRPQIIPILASAGVSVNAQDEHGFTPLMYAATIDFGDTAVLQAILKAGGDPTIPNQDGRNAIQQAHHFGHVNLEAVLRKNPKR
jgi:ankyrin repeat protein